jgi:hypothetical protein
MGGQRNVCEKYSKEWIILLIFPITLLLGCTYYNPPKYVCDCRIWCKSFTYGETEYSYTFGNNTIEDTKADCERYTSIACGGRENVINYTCNPMTWKEWNKYREKILRESPRKP